MKHAGIHANMLVKKQERKLIDRTECLLYSEERANLLVFSLQARSRRGNLFKLFKCRKQIT